MTKQHPEEGRKQEPLIGLHGTKYTKIIQIKKSDKTKSPKGYVDCVVADLTPATGGARLVRTMRRFQWMGWLDTYTGGGGRLLERNQLHGGVKPES